MSNAAALNKLTADQLAEWNGLLWVIEHAETQSMVARGRARADGYLLGLQAAGVIDAADFAVLDDDAKSVEMGAAIRTEPRPMALKKALLNILRIKMAKIGKSERRYIDRREESVRAYAEALADANIITDDERDELCDKAKDAAEAAVRALNAADQA